MNEQDKVDLKIIFALTNAYENLYEKGEITAEQLDRVLSLIDKFKNYPPSDFEKELKDIFSV